MRRNDESAVIRRDVDAPGYHGSALALRLVAAVVLGTVGFYLSVGLAYVIADADMSSADTYRMMFPEREYIVAAIVGVTSALAYLIVAKGGLYRAIIDEGFVGWLVLCPVAIVLVILVRGIAVDLAYYPIHYDQLWSPMVYSFLIDSPLTGAAAYIVDGVWLFASSMLLAKSIANRDRPRA
jgi:hypothetical protein